MKTVGRLGAALGRALPLGALCLLVAFLFLPYSPAHAVPFSADPTFVLPNHATNTPATFDSKRPLANGYALRSLYYDKASDSNLVSETGVVLTHSPGSLSWGIPNSHSALYADPGAFETKVYTEAQTDGSENYFGFGSSQVWNWYVLTGDPGPVTLAVDILVQGEIFANHATGGNAAAIVTQSLGVLSNPDDLTLDYAMVFNGTVGWGAGLVRNNTVTVPNTVTDAVGTYVWWDIGEEVHELDYIIRSQPFTVTVGEPFRLSLLSSTQAFAGPGGEGEAWADFFDPRLVTSYDFEDIAELTPDGFSLVVGDGQYSDPSLQGYSIAVVPEPSALILLGSGWIGLIGFRRRSRK